MGTGVVVSPVEYVLKVVEALNTSAVETAKGAQDEEAQAGAYLPK